MLKMSTSKACWVAALLLIATALARPVRLPASDSVPSRPTAADDTAAEGPGIDEGPRERSSDDGLRRVQAYGSDAPPAGKSPAVEKGLLPSAPIGSAPPAAAPAKKPPVQPWKILFFENDFSYKSDPQHTWLFGEELKDIPLADFDSLDFLPDPNRFSYGGELRFRQMDEANRLRPPPKPGRGDYQLWRWRQYLDLKVADWLRVYAEGIDASMDNNPLAVTGIDINRWDLQNLFLDLRLWTFDDDDDRPVWFRVGRQELLYGSQRLVSPLDWANTRRNFEGLKFFTRGKDWDFDLWFTHTVNTATFGDGPVSLFGSHFDSPNLNHSFSGAWFTYKAVKEHLFDLYWLWDWNSKLPQPGFQGGNRHTLATRWLGNFPAVYGHSKRTWHGEIEGGYQFGTNYAQDVSAGFIVGGIGHTWNDVPWQPDLWVVYDWASGSSNLNGRTTNTFNQQVGLVHAFLGQIDNIARQNVSDINTKMTVKPLPQFTFQTQHHWFDLANSGDVLYTITGAPLGKPHTGTHVGNELDLLGTYVFNPNFNVQIGYFWFWYGAFVENNAPRRTAEQLYIQTTMSY